MEKIAFLLRYGEARPRWPAPRGLAGFLTLVGLFCLVLVGCRTDEAQARLILRFEKQAGAARSIVPSNMELATIKILASGPDGAEARAESSFGEDLVLELLPGTWTVTATGYTDANIEVASGSINLDLVPGSETEGRILLTPIAGAGSIKLGWSCAGTVPGLLTIEGSLSGPAGAQLAIASPFEAEALVFSGLASGAWKLELRLLSEGSKVCGLAEAIVVAANMETEAALRFEPPDARLGLTLVAPDYGATTIGIKPALRRAAFGTELAFRCGPASAVSWYLDGSLLAEGGVELRLCPAAGAHERRIDCLLSGEGPLPLSGRADLRLGPPRRLGPLVWAETLFRDDWPTSSPDYPRGLGDCRDLAWTADSSRLAAAGKEANAISLFEASMPGSVFVEANAGGSAEPRLLGPSCLRFLPSGRLLAISESEGAVYGLEASAQGLSLGSVLSDALLAGAKDLAVCPEGREAYVAAPGADLVARVSLDASGRPTAVLCAAAKDGGALAAFSRPACLALSADARLLAVGTTGDDALYLFDRDPATGSLALRQRVDKTAFPAATPLSDPCSLAFSADGGTLFALSYYGKALLRLDRAGPAADFAPTAGAKSGSGGVTGFATPRRLAPFPGGDYLAVIGGGAEDGLCLFATSAPATLSYIGSLLPATDDALGPRPYGLAVSPDGRKLALATDGRLSLFAIAGP